MVKVKTKVRAKVEGQALIEFSMVSLVSVIILLGVFALLRIQWLRTKCAYLVFDEVHSVLVGKNQDSQNYRNYQNYYTTRGVQITESEDLVRGVGECGYHIREEVVLPRLHAVQWNE